jgi:hypothetical protein
MIMDNKGMNLDSSEPVFVMDKLEYNLLCRVELPQGVLRKFYKCLVIRNQKKAKADEEYYACIASMLESEGMLA